jgi:hypothetical protein
VINAADLLFLAYAYLSVGPTLGGPSPNWIPSADLTGDDRVSSPDLLLLASLYTQTCP